MKASTYDFRQFQEDLAALERGIEEKNKPAANAPVAEKPVARKPVSKKASARERMAEAKAEFLALCERYDLSIADVVVFFPEEEGIAYLQKLIAEQDAKPKRGRPRRVF